MGALAILFLVGGLQCPALAGRRIGGRAPAAGAAQALASALEVAIRGWSPAFWNDLGKALGRMPGG